MSKSLFDAKSCGRCGGSGSYSFNMMHGSTCYGCSGRGWNQTRKGGAAQRFLNNLRQVPVTEMKVGDVYLLDGCPGFSASSWQRITEIIVTGDRVEVNSEDKKHPGVAARGCHNTLFLTCSLRRAMSAEEKRAALNKALAYQETLDWDGTIKSSVIKAARNEYEESVAA